MDTRHVPTLELSQEFDRLCNEKGIVVPMTEYIWYETSTNKFELVSREEMKGNIISPFFVAPLVSESGEWLPIGSFQIENHKYGWTRCGTEKMGDDWRAFVGGGDFEEIWDDIATTEANARQKMLNYLIAEGKITVL